MHFPSPNLKSFPLVLFFLMFIYFWKRERERERERERMSRGGAERGRHRIRSRLQALSCQHRARSGAWTHKLWDDDLSRSRMLNRLNDPGAPVVVVVFFKCLFIFERDRDRVQVGEGQREGDTIPSRLQALSCQHRTQCKAQTHELGDHDLSWSWTLNRLSHPGASVFCFVLFL